MEIKQISECIWFITSLGFVFGGIFCSISGYIQEGLLAYIVGLLAYNNTKDSQ